ncbi:MAG: beta-galactosidase [Treponema sp.]|nr:beta-galactosidase [Treponema sp.]
MSNRTERPVEFGAVYFRRSAPPRHDWERDYERAKEDGITIFRHWFSWSAIEEAPGVFNWEPYDRQLELAAKYDIDTIIAEMSDHAPEWFIDKYPEARREDVNGKKNINGMNGSCVGGGAHVMCIDNPAVQEGVANFLRALGEHYRNTPGLYGYDIWNECSLYNPLNVCYCPGTQKEFRRWLEKKYGALAELNKAWFRFSFTSWDQVQLPRFTGPYPEFFDAINFQNDMQEHWFEFRCRHLRSADPSHLITAHGNGKSHSDIAPCAGDDWRYAKHVDIFGYTFWYANKCNTVMGGDIIRSAANGKEFWRAEALGDSDWQGRSDKTDHIADKDAMSVPENIRLDAMMSFVTGATGFLNPRYRPLLDGHLFHAFGWYGPDGSRTDRSAVSTEIAKWCNAPARHGLWKAKPVKGDIALLLLEDSQALCYAVHGNTELYAACLCGAYNAFIDSNIQSDIIRLPQLDDYDTVYVPYPLALSNEACSVIAAWVKKGGFLISEGCFGYFDNKGHAIEWQQPNRDFAEVFGCTQTKVHLGPDRNKDLLVYSDRGEIHGGVYQQEYKPDTARSLGVYADGSTAIALNGYGKGRALIIGTMPGYGYRRRPDEATRRWFASLITLAGKREHVKVENNTGIVARLWQGEGCAYLWVLNMTEHRQTADVSLDASFITVKQADLLRGLDCAKEPGNRLSVGVENRDAAVIRIC